MITKSSGSNTKFAKQIIRDEIKSYYDGKDFLQKMQFDANSYSAGRGMSDWNKGKELVNAGCFAHNHYDQREMLAKIYGRDNVEKWNVGKVHNTYANLIGREYSSMLKEREKRR